MYIFLIYSWIILIISGLVIKKSKILVAVQLLFISGMIAMNNGNPDQWQYINLYNQLKVDPSTIFSDNVGLNILFYISSIFNQYNLSIFLISCFFMLILYKAIGFYTINISYVFSLYLISPFVIDTVQIKNMYATIIWLYFSRYLYSYMSTKEKKKLMLYFIGVILASSIHFAFFFTALFSVIVFINRRNLLKFIFSLGTVFFALVLMIKKIQTIVLGLASTGFPFFILLANKFQDYGSNYKLGTAIARRNITLLFYILIFIIFWVVKLLMKRDRHIVNKNLYYMAVLITVISVIIIPLMIYSQEIYRVQRNLLLLYYVMFATSFQNLSMINLENKTLNIGQLFIFVSSILTASFYLYIDSIYWNFDTNFRVLFKMLSLF